jgi:hypothetical protein
MTPPAPNLFIVGAAKAGTTSLHHYLAAHPEIYMSPVKEPHYHSGVGTRRGAPAPRPSFDAAGYRALFAAGTGRRWRGESSTSYLWSAQAPGSIAALAPDARIIIVLRDPIERAFSHYLMDLREGFHAISSFTAALEQELANPPGSWEESNLYVELGLYAAQVARYLELFGAERVQLVSFAELAAAPAAVLERLFAFLGVDPEALDPAVLATRRNGYARPRGRLAARLMDSAGLRRFARTALPASWRRAARVLALDMAAPKPFLEPQAVALLRPIFAPDLDRLEALLPAPVPGLRAHA